MLYALNPPCHDHGSYIRDALDLCTDNKVASPSPRGCSLMSIKTTGQLSTLPQCHVFFFNTAKI